MKLHLEADELHYTPDQLFQMAARKNPKRAYLFVSKVIGKHIAVNPAVAFQFASQLANKVAEVLPFSKRKTRWKPHTPVTFFGYAETATGLAHAVFREFENASFLHSTRVRFPNVTPLFSFEEEHSHATRHDVYATQTHFHFDRPLVLVDDEISTGNTIMNTIQSLHDKIPRKHYVVASLLDWRTAPEQEAFIALEAKLGCRIDTVTLLKGEREQIGHLTDTDPQWEKCSTHSDVVLKVSSLSSLHALPLDETNLPRRRETGRFGLTSEDQIRVDQWCHQVGECLREKRKGSQTLVLGTGEFMYLPMRIALSMGEGVVMQSTTRSPILVRDTPDYAVRHGLQFDSIEGESLTEYVYNVGEGMYDELFLLLETMPHPAHVQSVVATCKELGIEHVHVYTLTKEKEGSLT